MSAKERSDVQRENGSGRGPGPRPAIGYATDRPLSTSVPGRGVDVVMDCRRRPPESPNGGPPQVRRRRVRLSASRCGHCHLHWQCPHREAEPWLQEARAQGVRPARCSAGVNLLSIERFLNVSTTLMQLPSSLQCTPELVPSVGPSGTAWGSGGGFISTRDCRSERL